MRVALTTITLVAMAGAASIIQAAANTVSPSPVTVMLERQVHTTIEPAEDDPGFNCIRHGNRACGVRLDPKPNDGVRQVVRYVIIFNKKGQPVDVVPFGQAPLRPRG